MIAGGRLVRLLAAVIGGSGLALAAPAFSKGPVQGARIVLVGDSTQAPRTGYGPALCALMRPEVSCINRARGGRSTKSFRAEGLWDGVLALLAEPDPRPTYVLIQFGHNDQPGKQERTTDLATEFPANLARYVDEARAKGAHPVLVTPLTRRTFRNGALGNDLVPWAEAMRRVAKEKGVPLMDLNAESAAAVQRMGASEADELAMPPPDFDRTHLGVKGGAYFAKMAARELAIAVPALEPLLAARPHLDAAQAATYSRASVLRDWEPFGPDEPPARELIVDRSATADGERTFATVQAAVDRAVRHGGTGRVRIVVKPGRYEGLLYVPEGAPPISLAGGGANPGDTRIRATLDARMAGVRFASAFSAAFETSPDVVKAMFRAIAARAEIGTSGSTVAWIRADRFEVTNLTFENGYNRDRGDADPTRQSQAVALTVDGADRARFEDVRFEGFQDTLYLKSSDAGRVPRVFLHRAYIEGDMDFIFGDATAYFLASEIRTLGDRAESFALAPSTHFETPYGFVFEQCAFTSDASPNAKAGRFKLARQWYRSQQRQWVGKVLVRDSRIGGHIDRAQPWASWNAPGSPRYRPVQYDSDDHWAYLEAAGVTPASLGYSKARGANEPFLAEYRNTHDKPEN